MVCVGEQTALPRRRVGKFRDACCSMDQSGASWARPFDNGALTLKCAFKKEAVLPRASKNGNKENRASRFDCREEREGKDGFRGRKSERGAF